MEVIVNFIKNGVGAQQWKGWGKKIHTDSGSVFQGVHLGKFSRNLEINFRPTLPTIFLLKLGGTNSFISFYFILIN